MILSCGCKHGPNGVKFAAEYQDEFYGAGNRVYNKTAKDGVFRCTVCGREINKGSDDKKKGNKESAQEDPKGRTKKN